MQSDSGGSVPYQRDCEHRYRRFPACEINIGDIVVSTDAVQHDMDASGFGYRIGQIPRVDTFAFEADEKLRELAIECNQKVNPEIQAFPGRVVSGDQFISDKAKGVADRAV